MWKRIVSASRSSPDVRLQELLQLRLHRQADDPPRAIAHKIEQLAPKRLDHRS